MKIQFNLVNVILLGLIVLFAWLWLSKPTDVIIDDTKEKALLKEIELQKIELEKSIFKVDSINKILLVTIKDNAKIEAKLKILNKKYNEQVNIINSQFITADIELFRANYISDSTSN